MENLSFVLWMLLYWPMEALSSYLYELQLKTQGIKRGEDKIKPSRDYGIILILVYIIVGMLLY